MKFEFGVADRSDDAAIRRLLAGNPMPGRVTVAFEREPDYFFGHGVMGDRCVTLKATDTDGGELAGLLCLASADRYIHGSPRQVGYLGQIRIARNYTGYLLPMRAAHFVRAHARQGWPDLWFSAIVSDNPVAGHIFASRPRPSFPRLEEISRIETLGIFTRSGRSRVPASGSAPELVAGAQCGLGSIVEFLNREGSRREFFPVYRAEHFSEPARTPGFSPGDFVVAMERGRIAGVCGVWNQSAFKQTVVHGYSGWLGRLRPLANAAAPLLGAPRLPAAGEPIRSATLSFLAVRDDDAEVMEALLREAVRRAGEMGLDYLLAGFSDRDPNLAVARRFGHITYRSTMYAFGFGGDLPDDAFDRRRVPYLEIAAL